MTAVDLPAVRAQLKEHEGVRLTPYTDSRGILTIGVGRNLTGKGLSIAEVDALLENDISECLTDLQTFGWFGTLDAGRLRAVIDLRFNMGAGTFRTFVHFLAAMAAKDYASAAHELENSGWARQVQSARRDRIVALIRDGQAA